MSLMEFFNDYRKQPWVNDILIKPSGPKDVDILIITNDEGKELFHKRNIESALYIRASSLGIDLIAYSKGKIDILTKNKETYFVIVMSKRDYELITGGKEDGE